MNVRDDIQENASNKFGRSRLLSILDYFEKLQVEYIVADLRCKIYPKIKDKTFWNKVKEGKRLTIQKLAERNGIPSIFTDEGMLRSMEKQVFREMSHPIFTYRNDIHKQEQEYLDLQYYYSYGVDVRVNDGDDIKIGKIDKEFIPYKHNELTIKINGVNEVHHMKYVTRII